MSAAKARAAKRSAGPVRSALAHVLRRLLPAALVAGAVGGGGYLLWQSVAPFVLPSANFDLMAERITLTPPPPWIRSDIKQEVLRDASLDRGASILDDDLAARAAKAFQLHPWIARVESVRKVAPAGLVVEVIYRRPVCMVEVPGGLYAVDADAVLLPSGDFSPAEARRYPRLSGTRATTAGPVGTIWPDARVQSAARLAATLVDVWESLDFNRIMTTPSGELEVYTARGTRVLWGHAEGDGPDQRDLARAKVVRLQGYAAEHGGLDASAELVDLDVRDPSKLTVTPRSANDRTSPAAQSASHEKEAGGSDE